MIVPTLFLPSSSLPSGGFAVQVQVFFNDGTYDVGAIAGACGQVVTNATTYQGCTAAPPPAWTYRASTVPVFAAVFASAGETMTSITMTYQGVTASCTPPCGP